MSQRTKITIFNAALTRTGNDPIASGDGSMIGNALEANYDEIVRAAFEGQEFTFGKRRVELTARSEGDFGYDDAYTYPIALLHVTDVFLDGNSAADLCEAWDVNAETRQLLINGKSRKVEVEGLASGLEHTWSGKFALAIQMRLEAVIKDVIEEVDEANSKDSAADYQLLKAGVKSSKNRSRRRVRRGGRLVDAHRGLSSRTGRY